MLTTTTTFRRNAAIATYALAMFLCVSVAEASVVVEPVVLDYKAKARDIISHEIRVRNLEERKISVYPVVQNVDPASGAQVFADPSRADLSNSLANWIFISRGALELLPHETKSIPAEIRVNLTAKPGIYHAVIAFPEGSTRDQAEASLRTAATLAVNLEVLDPTKEILSITRFAPHPRVVWHGRPGFVYELENTGDTTEVPSGDLLLYDATGAEIGVAPANPEQVAIPPGERKRIEVSWDKAPETGRYKALLALAYGTRNPDRVSDTAFFWVLPWWIALVTFLALFLLTMGLAWWLHRRYERAHHAVFQFYASGFPDEAPRASAEPEEQPRAFPVRDAGYSPNIVDLRGR